MIRKIQIISNRQYQLYVSIFHIRWCFEYQQQYTVVTVYWQWNFMYLTCMQLEIQTFNYSVTHIWLRQFRQFRSCVLQNQRDIYQVTFGQYNFIEIIRICKYILNTFMISFSILFEYLNFEIIVWYFIYKSNTLGFIVIWLHFVYNNIGNLEEANALKRTSFDWSWKAIIWECYDW